MRHAVLVDNLLARKINTNLECLLTLAQSLPHQRKQHILQFVIKQIDSAVKRFRRAGSTRVSFACSSSLILFKVF